MEKKQHTAQFGIAYAKGHHDNKAKKGYCLI